MSQFLAVRALLEEDTPKKEIARRLKIDVRTVRNWAKRIQKDGATSTDRRRGPSKLDPHRDRIAEKVEQGLSATQIHDDLRALDGFNASYVVVRRLVRDLKQRAPEVYCRMHYEPGEEMQIDFGDVGLFRATCHDLLHVLFELSTPAFYGHGAPPSSLRPSAAAPCGHEHRAPAADLRPPPRPARPGDGRRDHRDGHRGPALDRGRLAEACSPGSSPRRPAWTPRRPSFGCASPSSRGASLA